MLKKKNTPNSDYIDLKVKLKSFMGISPGIYLTVIYAAVLGILIFLILFLPGFTKKGSRVYFTTYPEGAAVYVNSEYAGSTPFKGFLYAGMNEIVIKKPGFNKSGEVIDVKGYVFATVFKKPELILEKKLDLFDYRELYEYALDDYLRWASIEDFHESYQPEMVISKTIAMLEDGGKKSELTLPFLEKCFKNLTREYLLGDFIRGVYLFVNSNNPFLPDDLLETASFASDMFSQNPDFFIHLLSIIDKSNNEKLSSSIQIADLIKESSEKKILALKNKKQTTSPSAGKPFETRNILSSGYYKIPSGTYLLGNQDNSEKTIKETAPAPQLLLYFDEYFISVDKVTNRKYLEFVKEMPFWGKQNLSELVEKNLADTKYLLHWPEYLPLEKELDKPVSNISWYAADAYCIWLTEKMKQKNLNYKAVIPDEYMWETASLSLNVLWDWCSNWFNTADYIKPERFLSNEKNSSDRQYLKGIEKSVRGGSFINEQDEINHWTRASQPPHWCTPFTGFRTALLENK
ncbi:MAG: SUMF1/EgtB/PvdO family nonheme iron enzyme [Spirochaetia bacterium]|jgi:formylglycine-generating enzyme required for sulfatase activity|nr:SUMF1/EgtB/PvdO family nonheme iron enzyme [Spirochaetia bacterium]